MMMGVAIIVLTHPITVLLHELGHAIPAILFTQQKVTIYIGSYGETTKSLKFRVGLLEVWIRKSVFWRTGLCQPSSNNMSLTKNVIFILGGPLASSTFAVITSYYVFAYDLHGALKMIMSFFMLSAIYDFLSNIIPSRIPIKLSNGRVCYNDGNSLHKLFYFKRFLREYDIAAELYNKKEFEKSAAAFTRILQLGFESEEIYRLAYTSYILNKQYQQAYELLTEFETKNSLNSDDYYNFGFVCTFLNLEEGKKLYFKKSLDLNPNHPHALNAIGYRLNTEHRYEEALSYFQKAITIEPEHAYAYNNQGYAKIEMGLFEEGLADINYSLQLDKENSYAYRNLGIYYLKLNQLQEAKHLFVKAKDMDKNTELIEELLSKTTVKV